MAETNAYAAAGVDVEAGNQAVAQMATAVKDGLQGSGPSGWGGWCWDKATLSDCGE